MVAWQESGSYQRPGSSFREQLHTLCLLIALEELEDNATACYLSPLDGDCLVVYLQGEVDYIALAG